MGIELYNVINVISIITITSTTIHTATMTYSLGHKHVFSPFYRKKKRFLSSQLTEQ